MDKTLEKIFTVTEDRLAVNAGSGELRVLATPALAAFAENTAAELAKAELAEGITTVGTSLELEHISPTPVNAEVRVSVKLESSDGRTFRFDFTAYDAAGEIAKGSHTRVSVKADKFQRKADEKLNEI